MMRSSGLALRRLPGGEEAVATLPDEAATLALGQRLGLALQPGLKVYLRGDLGAGKTTLVRGALRALGYGGRVKSPTFGLVEVYSVSSLYLYHFDFYRFKNPQEWRDAGFREEFGGPGVCLVEWPEKGGGLLPVPDLTIALEHDGEGRRARLTSTSERGRQCLDQITQ
jgi:tRNA threonylcarbamoyladenosine biosynthesis protein TsaE